MFTDLILANLNCHYFLLWGWMIINSKVIFKIWQKLEWHMETCLEGVSLSVHHESTHSLTYGHEPHHSFVLLICQRNMIPSPPTGCTLKQAGNRQLSSDNIRPVSAFPATQRCMMCWLLVMGQVVDLLFTTAVSKAVQLCGYRTQLMPDIFYKCHLHHTLSVAWHQWACGWHRAPGQCRVKRRESEGPCVSVVSKAVEANKAQPLTFFLVIIWVFGFSQKTWFPQTHHTEMLQQLLITQEWPFYFVSLACSPLSGWKHTLNI